MKTIVFTLLLALTSLQAQTTEEWSMPFANSRPSKKPGGKYTKVAESGYFTAFKTKIDNKLYYAAKVSNGKHKQGPASIKIRLNDAPTTITVKRIFVHMEASKILAKGNGEHFFDSFQVGGNTYEMFFTVANNKIGPKLITRKK